jgi:hypothetical protein
MNRAEGLNTVATGIANISLGTLNIIAGSVDLVMKQILPSTQANQDPSTPTPPTLSDEDIEALIQTYPFYIDILQKYSEAFDKTHASFLDQTFLSANDLAALKKDYLNLITHQFNKTPGVEHNHADYYTKLLQERLKKSPVHFIRINKTIEQTKQITDVNTSLAYQWKTCDKTEGSNSVSTFLDKIADAHGLIQVIGWATQNENSLLAVLDAWNYYRYANSIAEARFIISSLIAPFYPLFTEYQNIAHREKNTLLKIIRTAMPMLIIAGFVISMTALIPVALPELAFLILAIPLLYLSFALASLYVKTKDLIYQGYRFIRYHNDINLFPEFQTNDMLKHAFKDQAENIRAYYIQAFKTCELIEEKYQQKTTLTSKEKKQRDENLEQCNTLILEWFDLRDNTKLGTDQTPYIALKRLDSDKKELNLAFNNIQGTQDELELQAFIHAMSQHLHQALAEPIFYDTQEDNLGEEPALTPLSSLRFFPEYVVSRSKIIEAQNLEAQISANL